MIRISDFIGGELKHVHFLNLAEYVSGRLFSVWIASKVDVFSPFLSLFALDEIHVFFDVATSRQGSRVTTLHTGIGWGNPTTLSMCS